MIVIWFCMTIGAWQCVWIAYVAFYVVVWGVEFWADLYAIKKCGDKDRLINFLTDCESEFKEKTTWEQKLERFLLDYHPPTWLRKIAVIMYSKYLNRV